MNNSTNLNIRIDIYKRNKIKKLDKLFFVIEKLATLEKLELNIEIIL